MSDQRAEDVVTDYHAGVRDGLALARKMVMAAPTLQPGGALQTRRADVPGGFPRIEDRAKDPDGDPNHVVSLYALRDAVLWWIDRAIEENR